MAYDEELAARVREMLAERSGLSEQKMFGGIGFMLGGNMCCGVHGEDLIVRLSTDDSDEALSHPHVRPMDITGRPMRGWLFVSAGGTRTEGALRGWVVRAADFAGSLPKKTKTKKKSRGAPTPRRGLPRRRWGRARPERREILGR